MNRKLASWAAALALAACHGSSNNQPVPPLPADCTLPAPVASALDGGQVLELGTHQTGDSITFTVPPGTASVSILQQAVGNVPLRVVFDNKGPQVVDNSVVPRFVYFPDGGVAYDDAKTPSAGADKTVDPSGTFVEFSADTPVAAAFTFPNTAASLAAGVTPGNWRFIVGDFAHECATEFACLDGGTDQDKYDIKVVLKPQAATANLDVNFYIVGSATTRTGAAFTAAVAKNDASVQRMIQTFTGLYGAQGITLRNVAFFDVSAADRAKYSNIVISGDTTGDGPCDQLAQMFLLSSANPGLSVNLFLVDDLVDTSPSGSVSLVGIDGTIPGTATLAGTVHSGAAVSMADLFVNSAVECAAAQAPNLNTCGADVVAYISAHETGHFLGLFHTTEAGGQAHDLIADTPECPLTSDRGGKGFLNNGDCADFDGHNFLFWLDDGLADASITTQQSAVLLRSPIVENR